MNVHKVDIIFEDETTQSFNTGDWLPEAHKYLDERLGLMCMALAEDILVNHVRLDNLTASMKVKLLTQILPYVRGKRQARDTVFDASKMSEEQVHYFINTLKEKGLLTEEANGSKQTVS